MVVCLVIGDDCFSDLDFSTSVKFLNATLPDPFFILNERKVGFAWINLENLL